jgi:hypothetical protein
MRKRRSGLKMKGMTVMMRWAGREGSEVERNGARIKTGDAMTNQRIFPFQ